MKYLMYIGVAIIFFGISCKSSQKKGHPATLQDGVSWELAQYRKSTLRNVHYVLSFDIPAKKQEPISGKETLSFDWSDSLNAPLQIDFKPLKTGVRKLIVNGEASVPNFQKEHLLIDAHQLKKGANQIDFEFDAGEAALNRKEDYLYTLFVPDRARTAFPCFDQPDLKATFSLSLGLPLTWQALSNGILQDSTVEKDRKTFHFATSDTLSTYLFAFSAGIFSSSLGKADTMHVRLLYRENDSAKIAASLKSIFNISSKAIAFYQKWTGIAFPFQKLAMTAIPNFQFGGMEHPGNIYYQSSSLFLDAGATQGQLNDRSNLIAHELAHMWFGDLVTMRWFSDVWMKEVFANFMADKCTRPSGSEGAFAQKFLLDHYPGAFSEDRTAGANPIRQPLDNLQNAGMLYGNIIYHKAPIMMRQLESIMGSAAFQKGVRKYLKKYSWGNASWPDLIKMLDQQTPIDLLKWNEIWVNQPGRPVFTYTIQAQAGKIQSLRLKQQPEKIAGRQQQAESAIWPQVFDVDFYYANGVKHLGIRNGTQSMNIKAARGLPKPLFILWNATGKGYGLWPTDTILAANLQRIKTPAARASAYINLYENMLVGKTLTPAALLQRFSKAVSFEPDELNLKLLTGYISNLYWGFLPPDVRSAKTGFLETVLWQAMIKQKTSNNKKLLFNTYLNIFNSAEAFKRLENIWAMQKPPQGIKLYEEDYAGIALQLALRQKDNQDLLNKALKRVTNPDRISRFKILMQAASSDEKVRDRFFEGLSAKENRGNEPAVGEALSLLNHPLRQPGSEKYIEPSLELLEEIQQTGDIFFPKSWLSATFNYYQSENAYSVVETFLNSHRKYNPRLRDKILQATDNLRRAQLLQHRDLGQKD